MNFQNFDLNLLVALDALLSERNVTRAAERLSLSQSAMSNALKRIRDHFDDQILARSGRELELTPLGRSLVSPVRELMLDTSRLLNADYTFNPQSDSRTFRVVMSDYCATVLMGDLMRILSAEAPGLRCEIVGLSERSVASLIAGEVDMCLTAQDLRLFSTGVDEALLHRLTLFEDDFVCAVDVENTLVGETLDAETYLRLPHAITRFGGGTVSIQEHALQRYDAQPIILAVAPTFAVLPSVLAGTPLVITIQRKLANRLQPAFPMRTYPCPIPMPNIIETLYWHQRSEHDKAHAWLRSAMQRASVGKQTL